MEMELSQITYQGPLIDDEEILPQVPKGLVSILNSINGFIQFNGGLHIRGACSGPDWHSLRRAWHGPNSISALFPAVDRDWVPFAEDCVGDQFLLKDKEVLRLSAEIGKVDELGLSLGEFFKEVIADPVGLLEMEPLLQFQKDQGDLPEGYLLHAYPPFCMAEAAQGVSLRAVPAWELHGFHSELAKALPEDGGEIRFEIRD